MRTSVLAAISCAVRQMVLAVVLRTSLPRVQDTLTGQGLHLVTLRRDMSLTAEEQIPRIARSLVLRSIRIARAVSLTLQVVVENLALHFHIEDLVHHVTADDLSSCAGHRCMCPPFHCSSIVSMVVELKRKLCQHSGAQGAKKRTVLTLLIPDVIKDRSA